MSKQHNALDLIGLSFIALAGAVFVLSFVACILIQGGFLGVIPDIYGGIAYFGGPLPIIPAAIGSIGVFVLCISAMLRWVRRSSQTNHNRPAKTRNPR